MASIIIYPIITSIIIGIYGREIGKKGVYIITWISIIMNIIKITKWYIEGGIGEGEKIIKNNYINIGINKIKNEIIIERYSIIMGIIVIIISSIVIIYSYWYMVEENNINRFIILLLIFQSSMLLLVFSYNYFFIFIGWEYVGLISFLLINYWYINPSNNKSAFKAIIFNKIGDLFFIIGLSYYIYFFPNLDLFNKIYIYNDSFLYFIFLAAIAKSAQIFYHVWLGDAMAGPTPVSALLHAATMVTAGIYLLIRNDFYNSNPLFIYISLFTILLGGISAINQYDIKKIIAYSTVSQIGYMLYSIGINNKDLAFYHLITHGSFKALLFLSAGIIIHNYYNEQDIRKLGSFFFYSPLSYFFFLIGTLSIISFPYLSGYYSKDNIILNSFYNNIFISSLLYLGVLFTFIYSLNLFYHLFFKSILIFPSSPSYPSIYLLLPLIISSIFIGYFILNLIIKDSIISFLLNLFSIPSFFHYLPYFLLFFSFFFIYLYNNFSISPLLHILFNKRFFFDSFYNYLSFLFLYPSSFFFYKFLDRGSLEFFGPISLYRFFFLPFSPFSLFSSLLLLSLSLLSFTSLYYLYP